MIENRPLGRLKISSGNDNDVAEFVKRCVVEKKKAYCIPLNLTKYAMSKSDRKLMDVINSADMVIADGVPIVLLSRRAGNRHVNRITGISLAEKLLGMASGKGWGIFLLGATPDNLERAIKAIRARFNGVRIIGKHHGYFQPHEVPAIIEHINGCGPDVLFLGMGLPQKEYFIADHLDKISVGFTLPVGGAFDIWAGEKKRSPRILNALGLEWLYRSIYDKSRAWLIIRYGFIFVKDFIFFKNTD